MKKNFLLLALVLLLCSHDMYLKLDSYFLQPESKATVQLFNGTFDKSENVIDRDRMLDASILNNGERTAVTADQWTEKDSITLLNFKTGKSGTYVVGVSTKARNIEMESQAFNDYLEHDGVKDMLLSRQENDQLKEDAIEKYSKHVKAIFQVGDSLSDDWQAELGYPIEFIPKTNPYDLHTGDDLVVQLLRDGKPLSNQLVYADYKPSMNGHTHDDQEEMHSHDGGEPHSHGTNEHENEMSTEEHEHPHQHGNQEHSHGDTQNDHDNKEGSIENHEHTHTHDDGKKHSHDHEHDADNDTSHEHKHEDEGAKGIVDNEVPHTHTTGQELRTNQKGEVTVQLEADGVWYLRTIHLVNSEEEGLTHESNWATLTFEVAHGHDNQVGHGHDHDDSSDEIPTWVFIAGSIIVIGGLFIFFNKKK
ncbi:DUF4198 domain-containing protein [Nonlabens agnitus]|uniref:NikM domain containing protein n=1 Tax=Nonlabens agnitus TaxID=870484 RepID=A0A2S9WQK0_9FLAO|nr:DUF4198 domain-containing protein [Nonlabens agnitus]PRP65759.1 hypothetical protein BST86_00950 [Nonlabens agnitus]